ncbi:hypothetical protein P4O66_001428 [Electrophorus voltai]|uniref:DUF7030 domain-containing protein n=1 Tax=Electrophorus voltai TaxID=2609070 RepID=A0AAD9DW60_9TELE|nr:hypothetical protein P4O66_001428 [Electrophorus voltai]
MQRRWTKRLEAKGKERFESAPSMPETYIAAMGPVKLQTPNRGALAMAVEARPELVGKRFLCVSGDGLLERGELAEPARWPWRAGVIRAVSHRDNDNPELTTRRIGQAGPVCLGLTNGLVALVRGGFAVRVECSSPEVNRRSFGVLPQSEGNDRGGVLPAQPLPEVTRGHLVDDIQPRRKVTWCHRVDDTQPLEGCPDFTCVAVQLDPGAQLSYSPCVSVPSLSVQIPTRPEAREGHVCRCSAVWAVTLGCVVFAGITDEVVTGTRGPRETCRLLPAVHIFPHDFAEIGWLTVSGANYPGMLLSCPSLCSAGLLFYPSLCRAESISLALNLSSLKHTCAVTAVAWSSITLQCPGSRVQHPSVCSRGGPPKMFKLCPCQPGMVTATFPRASCEERASRQAEGQLVAYERRHERCGLWRKPAYSSQAIPRERLHRREQTTPFGPLPFGRPDEALVWICPGSFYLLDRGNALGEICARLRDPLEQPVSERGVMTPHQRLAEVMPCPIKLVGILIGISSRPCCSNSVALPPF